MQKKKQILSVVLAALCIFGAGAQAEAGFNLGAIMGQVGIGGGRKKDKPATAPAKTQPAATSAKTQQQQEENIPEGYTEKGMVYRGGFWYDRSTGALLSSDQVALRRQKGTMNTKAQCDLPKATIIVSEGDLKVRIENGIIIVSGKKVQTWGMSDENGVINVGIPAEVKAGVVWLRNADHYFTFTKTEEGGPVTLVRHEGSAKGWNSEEI